jgi:hypothetical protein
VPSSSWFSFLRKTRPPALIFDVFDDYLPFLHENGVLPKSSALSNKGKTSSLSSQPGATTP